jgi:hypothetical protein
MYHHPTGATALMRTASRMALVMPASDRLRLVTVVSLGTGLPMEAAAAGVLPVHCEATGVMHYPFTGTLPCGCAS